MYANVKLCMHSELSVFSQWGVGTHCLYAMLRFVSHNMFSIQSFKFYSHECDVVTVSVAYVCVSVIFKLKPWPRNFIFDMQNIYVEYQIVGSRSRSQAWVACLRLKGILSFLCIIDICRYVCNEK